MQPGAFKALLAVSGIFAAGAVAGGVAAVAWERHQAHVVSEHEFTDRQLQRLEASLELTAEQVECMRPVMSDFAERVRVARLRAFSEVGDVWREINAQLESELTPHQLKKFRKIQARDLEYWEKEQVKRCAPPPEKVPAAVIAEDPDGLKLAP